MNATSVPRGRPTTKRRALRAWAMFGIAGIALGSVWAAGFNSSTATVDGTPSTASPVNGTAGASSTAALAGKVTSPEDLSISFSGRWGVVSNDASMFKVDLTGLTGTYYASVLLTNDPTGWEALQLKFAQVTVAPLVPCDSSTDFSMATTTAVMPVETLDAQVTFGGLAGGGVYCIGVADQTPKAADSNGTFLRRPGSAATPVSPVFLATLNRSA